MANEEAPVVNEPVVADPTPTDSAPVDSAEDAKSEVVEGATDTGEYSAADLVTDSPKAKESASDEPPKAEETEGEAQPRGKAEDRKQQLNNEIRDLVSQRNAIKDEVERLNTQAYQPVTEEQLLEHLQTQVNPDTGEYFTPGEARNEARIAAFEQRQSLQQYNERVVDSRINLSTEANQALRDFPEFDPMPDANGVPTNPLYDPVIAAGVDNQLGANLVFDQKTGQVIGSRQSVYQLYQTAHNIAERAKQAARLDGQRAAEKMLSSADNAGSAQQGEPSFASLPLAQKEAWLRRHGRDV